MNHAFYIASADGTLWGFGATPEAAVAEANQWLDAPVSLADLPRYVGSAMTSDHAGRKSMTDQGEMLIDQPVLMDADAAAMFGVEDIA